MPFGVIKEETKADPPAKKLPRLREDSPDVHWDDTDIDNISSDKWRMMYFIATGKTSRDSIATIKRKLKKII